MRLFIKHQEKYSRGQLLLRTFFGFFYILIPHGIALWIMGILSVILTFISWFAILFTGKYPKMFFDYQVGFTQWTIRVGARMLNLCDGYPPFGLTAADDKVSLEVPYPAKFSRGILLLKTLFGQVYVMIPHGIILAFLMIGAFVVMVISWFTILFAGIYPDAMHEFMVGILRWSTRVQLYFFLSDKYPPFSLKPDSELYPAETTPEVPQEPQV